MTTVRVSSPSLDALIVDLGSIEADVARIAREEFGEGAQEVLNANAGTNFGQVVRTRSRLRGGDPRNTIESDGIAPVETGRLVNSWQFRQPTPTVVVLSSDVADPRSGFNYADTARKRGRPVGSAFRDLVAETESRMSKRADTFAQRLAEEVERG